jgi:hypothetical protein
MIAGVEGALARRSLFPAIVRPLALIAGSTTASQGNRILFSPIAFRGRSCNKGATDAVPCYKAHNFNILRAVLSPRAGTNSDAFALKGIRVQWPE